MASQPGGERMSLRHGIRCATERNTSVEDVLVAIAEQVGAGNIDSASRMNKAVVVFLKDSSLVAKIVASGLWVKDVFVQVTPLAAPATKIVISNVPPFIKNVALEAELARFGKFASAIKMIPLGCKTLDLKHVLSFRRQIFMFLNSATQNLDVSFRVKHGEGSYVVFASTESLRCFECGDIGHMRRACPHKERDENTVVEADNVPSDVSNEKASVGVNENMTAENVQRDGEVEAAPGVQAASDPGMDDPQEGTSGCVLRSRSEERSGRLAARGKSARIRRPRADTGQSTERKKGRVEDGVASSVGDGVNELASNTATEKNGNYPSGSMEGEAQNVNKIGMVSGTSKRDGDIHDEDGEFSDSSEISDITASQVGDGSLYGFDEINDYLDSTKGKAVNVLDSFSDGEKFLRSARHYMKTVGLDVLSSQKRFRFKKHCTYVRKNIVQSTS